jgi:hypothetical protein
VAALDLAFALTLVGLGWLAISATLARSLRRGADPTETTDAHLAGKTAPWRVPPDNRGSDKLADLVVDGRV